MGFTDHDRDLTVDGQLYEALSGFTGTELHESLGMSVDNQELQGAIRSDRITEEDILSGDYDSAKVTLYRVNWADPTQFLEVKVGTLGEITRSDSYFKAEFRGFSHVLQQPQGRIYQYQCDVDLGSERCTVNLASYTYSGTVSALYDLRLFAISGTVAGLADNYVARGKLVWTSGANAGRAVEIKSHGSGTIEVWQEPVNPVAVGDTFTVTAGCDKQPKTCRDKYANFMNYQGFPYMPGSDYPIQYVKKDDTNQNGESLVNIFG
jgi:uncharacterized phage protein (TIGR02218 family)